MRKSKKSEDLLKKDIFGALSFTFQITNSPVLCPEANFAPFRLNANVVNYIQTLDFIQLKII